MVDENINDISRWNPFVLKVIQKTQAGEIVWEDISESTNREKAIGPIFQSEFMPSRFLAVYKYEYHEYFDEFQYEKREEVAIELINEEGKKLWPLPEVPARYELIDLLEYLNADAEKLLEKFLDSNET